MQPSAQRMCSLHVDVDSVGLLIFICAGLVTDVGTSPCLRLRGSVVRTNTHNARAQRIAQVSSGARGARASSLKRQGRPARKSAAPAKLQHVYQVDRDVRVH